MNLLNTNENNLEYIRNDKNINTNLSIKISDLLNNLNNIINDVVDYSEEIESSMLINVLLKSLNKYSESINLQKDSLINSK